MQDELAEAQLITISRAHRYFNNRRTLYVAGRGINRHASRRAISRDKRNIRRTIERPSVPVAARKSRLGKSSSLVASTRNYESFIAKVAVSRERQRTSS